MRHARIGFVTAVVVASTLAATGCSSTSNSGGLGGSNGAPGTGGSANGMGGKSGSSDGGTGGGSGNSVTTVSRTKAISALSAAEATQLCNDTYSYFDTAVPRATACKWNGLSRAASSSSHTQDQLQQGCALADNSCLQSDAGAFTNPGCGDLPANCTATVAQYAACVTDEVTAFKQTVDGFPECNVVTLPDTSAIFDALAGGTPPASCTSLGDACPALVVPNPFTIN
jgi:hypothetical protein